MDVLLVSGLVEVFFMSFISREERNITSEEMADLLDKYRDKFIWVEGELEAHVPAPLNQKRFAFYNYGYVFVEIWIRNPKTTKLQHLWCYLDERDELDGTTGSIAYNTVNNHYWKVPVLREDLLETYKTEFVASPLISYNPTYNGQRVEAWGYDLNSAYAFAMLTEWADFSKEPEIGEIDPEKHIGFRYKGDKIVIQRTGWTMWRFDKAEVPEGLKRFVEVYYKRKKDAGELYKSTGDIQHLINKLKAKQTLNFFVGFLQRRNPFIRAWIVCLCNEYIENLIDDDTLFWNTDSIVSKRRRYDLEENLGLEVGQWKLEHTGEVAYLGNNYQWNKDIPTYRGIPKTWFPADYDILRDGVPVSNNPWVFIPEELKIIKRTV